MSKWYALFSQTGSEIRNLSRRLNRSPDAILTNSKLAAPKYKRKTHEEIMRLLIKSIRPGDIITLHGYTRLIPDSVLTSQPLATFLNGHPALITRYPELKGIDPQPRVLLGNYTSYGGVIHRVLPGVSVDSGPVVAQTEICSTPVKDTFDLIVRAIMLGLWEGVLTDANKIIKTNIAEYSD